MPNNSTSQRYTFFTILLADPQTVLIGVVVIYGHITYQKNAAKIAAMPTKVPALPKLVAAAPVKGVMVAEGDPVVGEVLFDVEFVETRVKFAQVRRVALLV